MITFKRIARDLAAENLVSAEYINRLLQSQDAEEVEKGELYFAQWQDGVTGQARVLNEYKTIGYDIGEFYHASGWAGAHPEHK
jgi:hypothetical protein